MFWASVSKVLLNRHISYESTQVQGFRNICQSPISKVFCFIFQLLYISPSGCVDGDVMLSKDHSPMFFKGGRFHPICRASFQLNKFGIELFCKQLGYQSGLITENSLLLVEPAIKIGKCLAGDIDLAECTGGQNVYKSSSGCSAGQHTQMKVVCFGGKGRTHTCGGMNTVFHSSFAI